MYFEIKYYMLKTCLTFTQKNKKEKKEEPSPQKNHTHQKNNIL